MASDVLGSTNSAIVSSITNQNWGAIVGWAVFAIIIIGASIWGYIYYRDKKIFSKKVTAFDIVGTNYVPSIRDTAKVVKLGKGGFEVLFLKKFKTWKIAYGGRVGKADYYFFIMPDGYWYNGMLSANMNAIDKQGGLIPIVTTNPLMRSQYTSLEKQIDSLHADKQSFFEKYGMWIMSIAFILVAGVMLWLCYQSFAQAMSNLGSTIDKEGQILDKLATLAGNLQGGSTSSGLVKVV